MEGGIVNTIFALLFAITIIAIVWGIVMYWAEIGSLEAAKEFKGLIINSVTALFLLICAYAVFDWVRAMLGIY